MTIEMISPHWVEVGIVRGRNGLPGQNRAHGWQNRFVAILRVGRGIGNGSGVAQRLLRLFRAVARVRQVVHVDGGHAGIDEPVAGIDEESNVFERTRRAFAAGIPGGLLDLYDRLEDSLRGIVTNAG